MLTAGVISPSVMTPWPFVSDSLCDREEDVPVESDGTFMWSGIMKVKSMGLWNRCSKIDSVEY